jgi:catechol 2,3-dioxygenase-like lactoylglutathione lyase family enzyme
MYFSIFGGRIVEVFHSLRLWAMFDVPTISKNNNDLVRFEYRKTTLFFTAQKYWFMEIQNIDHIVLTVADIEKTIQFYSSILDFKVVTFHGNRKALTFGNQKINLHQKGQEFEPKANKPTCGSADLCFISNTKLEDVLNELHEKGVEIIEGIVNRTGALGTIKSVYFRDPDKNLIEISNYTS